jgi:hypothetical protein
MAFTDQQLNAGIYVPTSYNWDITQIMSTEITDPQFKELIVRLYQNIGNIATALNAKESAVYSIDQFLTGQVWFNPKSSNLGDRRGCFRKVINVGALNAGVTTIAHGLAPTNQWKFTYIGGTASNTATQNYFPIPYAGIAGNNIELRVDGTNVIITNNGGQVFTDCYIVLEFLKS